MNTTLIQLLDQFKVTRPSVPSDIPPAEQTQPFSRGVTFPRQLATTLAINNSTYRQVERTGEVAIFEGPQAGMYEVIAIQVKPAGVCPSGAVVPCREVYPVSEQWGTCGWTYTSRSQCRSAASCTGEGCSSKPISKGAATLQLTDLMSCVSRIWTPPPKIQGRQTMIIPAVADTRDGRQADRVAGQCLECARLLAAHLYVWRKPFPEKATVKKWNKDTMSFVGLNIQDFQNLLMSHFTLKTADGREWLIDRSIAALTWNACCAEGSPLPQATWQIETDLKRQATR